MEKERHPLDSPERKRGYINNKGQGDKVTIYAVMIGAGITTICIQIVKWLAERKPEDMQYREIEPMDVEDSEPTNDIERSYPKLSLLDHSDYELIEGEYAGTEIYCDEKGRLHSHTLHKPMRIKLNRDFHLTEDIYTVSMPLDNRIVTAYVTNGGRTLIEY